MNLTIRQLKKLLSHLGIELCRKPNELMWTLYMVSSGADIGLKGELYDEIAFYGWWKVDYLIRDMFQIAKYFQVLENDGSRSQFANPYFGCKTFEEALIKKDLMSNGN